MADTSERRAVDEGDDYLKNTSGEVWDQDDPMRTLVDADYHPDGYPVPAWIDQEITGTAVFEIRQGGCASGAYMPAVIEARRTMASHGDAVIEYLVDHGGYREKGEIPQPKAGESWTGIAVFYLSLAVELWATNSRDTLDCGI
jgi:hypothetical protein